MAGLGPFETGPRLAVAVSGGADSLALCVLADEWARERGGAIVGLTVDHGLRPDSAAEAAIVRRWLAALGIEHHTLLWRGPKPSRGVQARAREARYRLLNEWCRAQAVLHLLVAHQENDQAETVLMRAAAHSGFDGLAGMAALLDGSSPRLLRPLLSVGRDRLAATLEARGQPWIEDPSNRDHRFARVRIRSALWRAGKAGASGLRTDDLCRAAIRIGRVRAFEESLTNEWLARCAVLHPVGYAWLDLETFRSAPAKMAERVLARIVSCIGGRAYAPRRAATAQARRAVLAGPGPRGCTLGGCRLVPRGRRVLVCREARKWPPALRLAAAGPTLWDGRFEVEVAQDGDGGLEVKAVGREGWRQISGAVQTGVPGPARLGLPALWRGPSLLATPHLGYRHLESPSFWAKFRPLQPFVPSYFAVARAGGSTI